MIEVGRILCPCDFSDFSRRALAQAVELANWFGSGVEVLHVHPLPVPAPALATTSMSPAPAILPAPVPPPPTPDTTRALIEDLRHFVKPAEREGARIVTTVEQGEPVATILEHAQREGVDLVVMGTHGRSGFERLVLGSTAEKVLRKAACPVLTVRADGTAPAVPRRVLCPIDFSDSSRNALRWALQLASMARAPLQVLTVVEVLAVPPPVAAFGGAEQIGPTRERAEAALDEALRKTGDEEPTATRPPRVERTVVRGKPHREIVELARSTDADLVVIGVHGHGVIDRLLFGSTTHHVVREAPCPVLSVRQPPEESATG